MKVLKNSQKIKKALFIVTFLSPGQALAEGSKADNSYAFILMGVIVLVGLIGFVLVKTVGKSREQTPEDIQQNGIRRDVEYARVKLNGHSIDELTVPRDDDLTFRFIVKYKRDPREYGVEVKPGSEDAEYLVTKLANYKAIIETQILAVNADQIVDTSRRVSVTKALLGGLIAGEAGFILGGLAGCSRSYVRNQVNQFTFLVKYSNGTNQTETVKENDQRFQTLVKYLKS